MRHGAPYGLHGAVDAVFSRTIVGALDPKMNVRLRLDKEGGRHIAVARLHAGGPPTRVRRQRREERTVLFPKGPAPDVGLRGPMAGRHRS